MTTGVWRRATGYGHHGMGVINVPAPSSAFEMTDLGSDLLAWFDAQGGTYMTLDGSNNVTQWTDRSGNARHLTPGALAAPPYASNKITALKSSGKGFATWAAALPASAWDCYFVADIDTGDGAGHRHMLAQPAGNHSYFGVAAAAESLELFDGTGSVFRFPSLTWTGLSLRQAMARVKTATTVDMNLDGGTVTAVASISGIALSTIPTVGNSISGIEGFGDMYEVVFATVSMSDANRQKIEGRLAWKWDTLLGGSTLVTSLPGGHPYKSAAP